jgi:DNA polymerase-3 subunit alpha
VTGRIDLRGRELQIRSSEVNEPGLASVAAIVRDEPGSLVVDLPPAACTPEVLSKLKQELEAHPGSTPVRVRLVSSTGATPVEVGPFRVQASGVLMGRIGELLGNGSARVEREPVLS